MLISNLGLDYIKEEEGFRAELYTDLVGVTTLGYGMTGELIKGMTSITEAKASLMLEEIMNGADYGLQLNASLVANGVKLAQCEFDALMSFAYNCGIEGLLTSTLYTNIKEGVRDKATITADFEEWDKGIVKGVKQVIPDLLARRRMESEMFFSEPQVATVVDTIPQLFSKALKVTVACNAIDANGAIAKSFKVGDQITAINEVSGYWLTSLGKVPKASTQEVGIPTGTITGVVTGNRVNIRANARINSTSLGMLNKGAAINIYKTVGDWYNIYYGRSGGYINKAYVKLD